MKRVFAQLAFVLLGLAGLATKSMTGFASPAAVGNNPGNLPQPPANGEMGFVVHHFVPPVVQGDDACPDGHNVRAREIFLATLPPDEAERLRRVEHQDEFMRRYLASVTRPDGANLCTNYMSFPERPLVHTVQSKYSWGLNLDGDSTDGSSNPDVCAHENFTSPDGETGIDNQAYRAMGCKAEWRGKDGIAGDIVRGYNGFLITGEWSQVMLLRGVDSLWNDGEVEVIYANTADRAVTDSSGNFLRHATYTISNISPRSRNVLRGRIVNGVLTTQPATIRLSQVWGQNSERETRGIRNQWVLHEGRLRLAFQPDGSLKGLIGGYQRIDDLVISISLGGINNLIAGGADCAGEYNTLKKLADGLRDPETGQCSGVSSPGICCHSGIRQ